MKLNTDIKKILIFAFTRLGDMLQYSPTIKALKIAYPNAHITVLGEKAAGIICKGNPEVDEIIYYSVPEIFKESTKNQISFIETYNSLSMLIKDLRSKNFDICLDVSYSSYAAKLVSMLNIPDCRMHIENDEFVMITTNPWRRLFMAGAQQPNRKYMPINLVDINTLTAGLTPSQKKLSFTPTQDDYAEIEKFFTEYGINPIADKIVCIQCGTSQPKRCWAPERFAAVARALIEEYNAWIIYPGAPNENEIISKAIAAFEHPRVINAAGLHNIPQLAALFSHCTLLLTGDTGPMHLAAAMGTPIVATFVGTSYCSETGPYAEGNIIVEPKIACYACSHASNTCDDPICYAQIDPEVVARLCKIRIENKNPQELLNARLSDNIIDSTKMTAKVSYFDEDGFLDFKIISNKNDKNELECEAVKAAYKKLWKEEFLKKQQSNRENNSKKQSGIETNAGEKNNLDIKTSLPLLDSAIGILNRCTEKTKELSQLLYSNSQDFKQLKTLVNQIEEFDNKIINLSDENPIFGFMSFMYKYEKDNITTMDAKTALNQTKHNHSVLHQRLSKFASLYSEEIKEMLDSVR